METLAKKLHIIENSSVHGSVTLHSLTNFSQVNMPPKFKAPEFIKYEYWRPLRALAHVL